MKHVCSTTRVYQDEMDQQHYQRALCFLWADVIALEDTTEIWEGRYEHVTKVNINDGESYHTLERFEAMAQRWEGYLGSTQDYVTMRFSSS